MMSGLNVVRPKLFPYYGTDTVPDSHGQKRISEEQMDPILESRADIDAQV
jgi:hypothetical protein